MQTCMAPMRTKWFYRHLCALAGCINMIALMAVNLASVLCRLLALWLFAVIADVQVIGHACLIETDLLWHTVNHTLVLLAQYALVTVLHIKHSLSVNFVFLSYSSLSHMVHDLQQSLSLRLYVSFCDLVQVGFVLGTDGILPFLQRYLLGPWFMLGTFVVCFSAVQIMFELRSLEQKRQAAVQPSSMHSHAVSQTAHT